MDTGDGNAFHDVVVVATDWTWEELERQRDCSLHWDGSALAQKYEADDWTWEELERQRDCSLRWDASAIMGAEPRPPLGSRPCSRLSHAGGGGW